MSLRREQPSIGKATNPIYYITFEERSLQNLLLQNVNAHTYFHNYLNSMD